MMHERTHVVMKEAYLELASFISDGYILYSQWNDKSHFTRHWYLRHSRNTNRLHIVVKTGGYTIIKNGREVKNAITTAS